MATGGGGVLRQLLAIFTFDVDAKPLKKGEKSLEDFARTASKIMKAMAGGAIGYAIKGFVDNTLDEMIAIKRAASELRITTDEMQGVKSAARSLGVDVRWLHFSMERLQVSMELAARGSKRQASAMKLLGLTAHDANGKVKNAYQLFLDTAGGIAKLKDPNKQAIAVWDLFGRGGHRLLPFLRAGKENIAALAKEMLTYGKYSKETLDKASAFRIELERGNMAWVGLKNIIFGQVLPVLERWAAQTRKGILWIKEMTKYSLLFEAALRVVTAGLGFMAIKMIAVNWQVSLAVAGIGALIVLVDSLMVWFRGGDSIIGRALKAIGGEELNTAALAKLRGIWKDIRDFVREVVEAMRDAGWLPKQKAAEVPYSSVAQNDLADRQSKKKAADAEAHKDDLTARDFLVEGPEGATGVWKKVGRRIGKYIEDASPFNTAAVNARVKAAREAEEDENPTFPPWMAGTVQTDPDQNYSGGPDVNVTIIVPEQAGVYKQSIRSADATRKRKVAR